MWNAAPSGDCADMEWNETTQLFRWQNKAFKWLARTWEMKTRMVSTITSHYLRRHWYVFHIGTKYWFCMFVMFIQSHPHHTHTHPCLVQEQLRSSQRFLQWHLGLVQVGSTFSRFHSRLCLYSIIDQWSLTVTEKM